jgi:integrase
MPIYKKDVDGRRVKEMSSKWYTVFSDWSETIRRLPLLKSKKASAELARKIDHLNSIRASGDVIPPELTRFVETMLPSIRAKLAKWGILSAARVAAGKPLVEHLADWKQALLAKGNTTEYAELAKGRTRKLFGGCGFKYWTDISASKVHLHLAEMRSNRLNPDGTVKPGKSIQTSNYYLKAAKQFCKWMVSDGRALETPLAHLSVQNAQSDRRHDRRAISDDEMRWLLEVTAKAPERFGMTGEARSMLYHVAVETGLRAGELRSLIRGSFDLEGDEPSITIAAAYAKNRRQDRLLLKPAMASRLKEYLTGKMPHVLAFSVPGRTHVVQMFRADLADARKTWLESHQSPQDRASAEQSTFLASVDELGRFADFHALRHTFMSNLAAAGVHPKTAQSLARHSTIALTMDRYTHLYEGNLMAALNKLPDLSPTHRQILAATGTYAHPAQNRVSPDLSVGGGRAAISMDSGGLNQPTIAQAETPDKSANYRDLQGFSLSEGDGARTRNHRIDSPVL